MHSALAAEHVEQLKVLSMRCKTFLSHGARTLLILLGAQTFWASQSHRWILI